MAAIRENILASATVRDDFLRGVLLLDREMRISALEVYRYLQRVFPGISMRGINQELSTYDLFVLWHVVAMSVGTPPGSGRNGAHSGPVFLPWHRMYLIRLEEELQRVLDDDEFGLPYWDWAVDGELPASQQWQTRLWNREHLGESRNQVRSGPLADVRVRLFQNRPMSLWSINPRPIERNAGRDANPGFRTLPREGDVRMALAETSYDSLPWSAQSAGHRNRLEGWIQSPQLHNRVHVWIGGDMGPGSSPNDPAFFLNHCNVDRIWEAWMANNGRVYRPRPNEGPAGHRIDDLMVAILGQAMTPREVLDPNQWYEYDSLTVA